MSNYIIISDSSCDIPDELLKEYQIELVPFYISFDQNTYYRERVELKTEDFYKILRTENAFPKTSLPSVQDYMDKFTVYLSQEIDIICFCLATNLSGSYQSAVNAKNILSEEYPDRKIEIINSHQATGGQGIIVLEAARMRQAGYSMDETLNKIKLVKSHSRIVFTVDSLEYLQKGGRIGKVASLVGNIFNIKPIIALRSDELIPIGKVRGRKKALKELFNIMIQEMDDDKNFKDYRFFIVNADCLEDAIFIKNSLKSEYNIDLDYPIGDVGVTIGSHTGPTAIGICFVRKYDTF